MSNTLKNVAESTASTLSDLVDEAKNRIEDLPPLKRARRRRTRKPWPMLAIVAVAVVMMMAMRRRRASAEPEHDMASDRRP